MEFEVIGTVIAGIGIFLVAFKYFSSYMQELISHDVRQMIAKYTSHNVVLGFLGVAMGLLLQDTNTMSCIVGSLVTTNVLSLSQALKMVIGGNIGAALFLYVIFINTKLIILYLLGLAGILFYLEKPFRWRYLAGSLFTLALMLFAVGMISSQAERVMQTGLAQTISQSFQSSSYLTIYLLAGVVVMLTQSDIPLVIITVNLLETGIIQVEHAMMIVYGIHLGFAVRTFLFSTGLRGAAKEILIFQAAFNCLIAVIFLLVFYLEKAFNLHFIQSLFFSQGGDVQWQIVNLFLFVNVVVGSLSLLFVQPIAAYLKTRYEASTLGFSPEPQFIDKQYLYDSESAMEVIQKECARLLEQLPRYIEERLQKPTHSLRSIEEIHNSFYSLSACIEAFIDELVQIRFSASWANYFFRVVDEFHKIVALEGAIYRLVQIKLPAKADRQTTVFYTEILEAHLSLLMLVADAVVSRSSEDWSIAKKALLLGTITDHVQETKVKILDSSALDKHKAVVLNLLYWTRRSVFNLQDLCTSCEIPEQQNLKHKD